MIFLSFLFKSKKGQKKLYTSLYKMYNNIEVISLDLKNLLYKRGIKQIDLARKLKISRQSLRYKIKSWEEKRKGFSIDELIVIAELFGETLNFFT